MQNTRNTTIPTKRQSTHITTNTMDDEEIVAAINVLWVFIADAMCFLLQAGFGLLEVGSMRAKNAQNVLLKNIWDACVAAFAYWAVGYGLAFGKGGNSSCSLMFWAMTYFGIFRVSEEAERRGLDVHRHGVAAYKRGSVVPSKKSNLLHADIETAKDEERMNPDIDASVGDVANHGEQSQKPYKSKTRTIIEHEEDLRRRFGSTLIAANMGHL